MPTATPASACYPTADGSVRVRRAEPSELDDVHALELVAFDSDRMSREQYRRHLDSDSALVLVANARRRFLGTAVVFFRRGSRVARLYSLASRPDARGMGVGSALLAASEAAARRRRCRALRLEVRVDNAAAISLYQQRGYRPLGRHRAYYEDGSDALRYEKMLD